MNHFEDKMARGGTEALIEAGRFFTRNDPVHDTLRRMAEKLEELRIPYAIVGGMALVAHGYDRTTVDVNVLVTEEGLAEIHQRLDGSGYVPPYSGSKQLRDMQSGVRIEFLVTGQYPGDGKSKPVAFPDPVKTSVKLDGIAYIQLHHLAQLKLASGMTNRGRLRDLADVQELIRCLNLGEDFAAKLDPYVREKYLELWKATGDDTDRPLG